MKKLFTGLLINAFLLVPLMIDAQTRGVGVRVKNEETDKTEEVMLYEASYALVIGVSDYTGGWPDLPGVKTDVEAVSARARGTGRGGGCQVAGRALNGV